MNTKTENLWKTLETINELIRFSDTKATAILAMNGVVAGFYFSNTSTIQTAIKQQPIAFMPLIVAVGLILVSSVFSAYCIIPRLKMNKSNCLIFFCDIANTYESANAYAAAIKDEMTDGKIETHITDQIWATSKIAVKKYSATGYSIVFFVLAVFASIAFMLFALWG
jgi:hypothetical protein